MKIIHILHHSQINYDLENIYLNFWKEDWHAKVATQILKRTEKYKIECWRPEKTANKIIVGQESGITYKIFPSYYLRFGMEYSSSMLKELKKESQGNQILIHLHGLHAHLPLIIANSFKNVPIVGQQHGDAPSLYYYNYHTKSKKTLFKMYFMLNHLYEKKSLKNIDKIFALTMCEKEYLSKLTDESKIEIQTMGIDFDLYKPIEKDLARKQLNLSNDKKIILYVGRFNKVKGVDLIIDAFKKLKDKYDLDLILIGGAREDIFYEKAKIAGAKVITRVPSEQLISYYSASDVYVCYMRTNLWGGIGIAPVEAMACNLPIVSNTLEHFPNNEGKLVGNIPIEEQALVDCLEQVIINPNKYSNCREISMKYYSWEKIINNTINIYDELSNKYYR
jgi:glycosyltransferase involved in cell wall biosynthesis